MSNDASRPSAPDEKIDWRDKAIAKKHAKLQQARREIEALRRVLVEYKIPIPMIEQQVQSATEK
jgi:hypothetical protein